MSRDGNGNYTLPLGAVATGEVIASTWANTSLDDIAAAMTDSLARSGNGGMLAPFRATDGTINAPSLSFNNETNSGVYRSSTGDYRLCVNGKDKARIRDVNGMAAFQVFDLAGTGAWETLATVADLSSLTLADVLAVGNTTGGTDLSVSAGDDLLLTDTSKIIGSNGLVGSLERSFELYVDGSSNGIVNFKARGNKLSITSETNVSLGTFGGWPLVEATQVEARLSYGVGVGVNLVKLETTAIGIDVTGTVEADAFSGTGIVAITDFIDDDTFTTATATNVPTAESVKAYVDTAGGNETLAETLALGNATGGTNLQVSASDDLLLSDTSKLKFETDGSNYLQIYKSAGASGTSYIHEVGGGALVIKGESGYLRNDNDESQVTWNADGVTLGYDGSSVLTTTATGIDVTGTVTADLLTLHPTGGASEGGQINFQRDVDDSNAWYVDVFGATTDTKMRFVNVNDGISRLEIDDSGIDVTGTIDCDTSLQIQSTGSDADAMPDLYMTNIETAADAQNLGMIHFRGYNDASTPTIESYANIYAQQVDVSDGAEKGKLVFQARNGAGYVEALQVNKDGIDVTGDLDVTGTITSNAFASSKATVNNAADILYTAFNSFAGKRIINTASATATTYGLPTPVTADIGKSWIICNPTDSEITIDHDASGTANYVWIMDGVTLSAAASSWTIKKGAIVEIVVAAAAAGGGSSTAPNYLIFGAGLLEIV